MRIRAVCLVIVTGGLLSASPAAAQLSSPMPAITAEYESWYLSNSPINVGGVVYYPAGPVTHFNRNEMVFTGLFERIPIFKRTTQEPGSVVYLPLAGGLVRPYERRRSGDLAGTVGSSSPSFPVNVPAAEVTQTPSVAAYYTVTTAVVPRPVGTTGFIYGTPVQEQPAALAEPAFPVPVGATGINLSTRPAAVLPRSGPARIETVQRPVGLNTVFLEFRDTRWYAGGPAVRFAHGQFTRVGDYRGFPVYEEKGRNDRIYISLVPGDPPGDPALIVPYKSR